MITEDMIAYSEINEIINMLEDEDKNKVPENIRNFFKEEKNNDYIPKIDPTKPLIEQNLKRETIILLTILNLNYWCENEVEKQKWWNELEKNQKESEELEEKYKVDNLFKKKNNIGTAKEKELQIVKYKKENIVKKILNRIMIFFRRES